MAAMRSPWRTGALLIALLAVAAGPAAAASRVTVTLDPPSFALDQSAELTITLTGDEDAAPIMPRVPGLVTNPNGQSSSIRQVNGVGTSMVVCAYRVTA